MSEYDRNANRPVAGELAGLDLVIAYALQPFILIVLLLVWLLDPANPLVVIGSIFCAQLLLGLIEVWRPARPEWLQNAKVRLRNIAIFVGVLLGTAWIADWYVVVLAQPLAEARTALGLDIWPHEAPLLLQAAMVFFLAELIWYWFHRAEHRWPVVWRVSGHGAHHSLSIWVRSTRVPIIPSRCSCCFCPPRW